MSKDHPHQTDEADIQPEGEDAPAASREDTATSGGQLPDSSHPVLEGISQIRSTLDQLEAQVADYRRLLAEEDAAAGMYSDGGIESAASPVAEEIDQEKLVSAAELIAVEAAALFDPSHQPQRATIAEGEPEIVSASQAAVVLAPPVIELDREDEDATDARELLTEWAVDMPALFEELQLQLEMGLHRNASVSIFVDGEELLAYLSSETVSGVTPQPAPLFRAFSSGKAMAAATIWRLLDAGTLEIDAPVARYWPEFAQRGKTGVTLRHVLTHTAGLPRDFGRGDVDWGDWGRMIDILASMPLEYEPGEVIHYHAITFGLLVAEIASRATGVPFEELFEREVKSPLNLSDTRFVIAADDADDKEARRRVKQLFAASEYHDREMPGKMDWLLDNQIMSPGASCVTTASDLARLYATVCNNGTTSDGQMWLSEKAAANVFATQASAYDIESMSKGRVGQGVWMFDEQPNRAASPAGSATFGHGGMGTSIAWGDPEHQIGVAIITDTMQQEELNGRRLNRISAAIRQDLGLPIGVLAEL